MLRLALFGLVAAVLWPKLTVQVPVGPGHHRNVEHHLTSGVLGEGDVAEWSIDKPPNPNATDHLVFETVYSLLQHWPNTRMRNGHNIVPGSIPKGTLLYHGTIYSELPRGPDWVATDPEHSYIFCRDLVDPSLQDCWQLTLATTRPLRVIYFDGSSAAKLPYGTLDTQDLIVWGKLSKANVLEEKPRIEDLCRWGRNFGVDGFVRMEMDFEVMLCNFTSGVSLVSSVNLVIQGAANSTGPTVFEVMNAGSWHNHLPGETRIQLELGGLVSFYDTQLAPSLVAIRAGQERWDHRAGNVSSEDLSAVKSRLEAVLVRQAGLSSGIDWKTLFQVIVDRYAQRLELTQYLLNSSATDADEIVDLANKTQTQLRIMLTPYLVLSATPRDPSDKTDLDWTIPIYKLCAMTHTYSMESEVASMTDAERLLLQAARGTSREICRVVTRMWAAGVYAGMDSLLGAKEAIDIAEITQLRQTWTCELNRLMAWLDWSVWIKCHPDCGPKEMCYLPTWPIGFPEDWMKLSRWPSSLLNPDGPELRGLTRFGLRAMVRDSLAKEVRSTVESKPEEWTRPKPRCISRIDPYELVAPAFP